MTLGRIEPVARARETPLLDAGRSWLAEAADWAEGRSWIIRAPLVLYLAYGFVRHLTDPLYSTLLFGGVTFGIHELGHPLFSILGTFMMFLGGSLAQVLAPLAVLWGFLRQEDYFAVAVGGSWLSFSLFNLATYIADARTQELPLLGLSDDPQHDWHYLLSHTGLLSADGVLAFLVRVAAFAAGAASIALAIWLCARMATSVKRRRPV